MRRIGLLCVATAVCVGSHARAEDLLVGVQLPLTGAIASYAGPTIREGIEIALGHIDAAQSLGPGRKIKTLVQDSASDKTQAITLTSRFCRTDNVLLMIGPVGTGLAAPAAPVANAAECPTLTVSVGREATDAGPWVFKGMEDPVNVILSVAKYIAKEVKSGPIHLVSVRDNAAAVSYRNALVSYLSENGIKDITEDTILGSDADFTSIATKITDLNPRALVIAAPPEPTANLILQAKQAGMDPGVRLFGADFLTSPAFHKVGGAAVDGVIYPTHFAVGRGDQVSAKFVNDYKQKFGRAPDSFAAVGYNNMMIAAEAFRKAGPNPSRERVREALVGIRDLPSVLGKDKVSIGTDRSARYEVILVRLEKGTERPIQ